MFHDGIFILEEGDIIYFNNQMLKIFNIQRKHLFNYE